MLVAGACAHPQTVHELCLGNLSHYRDYDQEIRDMLAYYDAWERAGIKVRRAGGTDGERARRGEAGVHRLGVALTGINPGRPLTTAR
jgi:hypothetical protein